MDIDTTHFRNGWRRAHHWWLAVLLLVPVAAHAIDTDGDGIEDVQDNCTTISNPNQHDDDGDLYGDVCDSDLNNDGTTDDADVAEFKWLMGTGDLEPDLNGDGRVDYRDLGVLETRMGMAPGPRGVTAAEIDPPKLQVNSALTPATSKIPGIPGFSSRYVARLSAGGADPIAADVVLQEVILLSKDPSEASDLAGRWGGAVMRSFDPAADLGVEGPAMYLIRVDPSSADLEGLPERLVKIDGRIHGEIHVSEGALASLIALIAQEREDMGLDVSMNVLVPKHGVAEREVEESAATVGNVSQPNGDAYTPNAFAWAMMEVDPDVLGDSNYPIDTRAMEAVRIAEAQGATTRRSRAMIWDGGFFPNADFPPYNSVGGLRVPNPDPTGCGTGAPPAPGSPCEAHGTHVVNVGWGQIDNGFGTAGPGGSVTDITLLQSPDTNVFQIVEFIFSSLPTALGNRPNVLNLSAGFDIPAGLCAFACPPLDLLTRTLTRSGTLIVASAGNDGQNVDAEEAFCLFFCVRFERSATVPCELDDVLCVGATVNAFHVRAGYSNFGTDDGANTVDIFAPGNVWSPNARNAENANPAPNDDLSLVTGTSFASPFVAGVANLVTSTNPALSARGVRSCIVDTAHGPGELTSQINRRINAADAVRCATGGISHPFVGITYPLDGASFEEGFLSVAVRAEADDAEDESLMVEWTSSIDGFLATTQPDAFETLDPPLSYGTHVLTATVRDSSGLTWEDSVTVTYTNPLAVLEVVTPISSPYSRYFISDTIELQGTSSDPNETPPYGPLSDLQVSWRIDGAYIGLGHTRTYPASLLGLGSHSACFNGIDDDGGTSVPACVQFSIDPDPTNFPPDVTLLSPAEGTDYGFQDGPIERQLIWTASDIEDGVAIPFANTRVLMSRRAGTSQGIPYFVDVTSEVGVTQICTNPLPPPFFCGGSYETFYTIELESVPNSTSTSIRIKIEAEDSDGNVGEDFNDVIIRRFF